MSGVGVRLLRVRKRYPGGIVGLVGLDLEIAPGERLAVLGPSGAGKTTLLRLIAGLERPDSGSVAIAGQPVDGVPPWQRGLAMVFQQPAVYPHLSVFENLAFGLRAARMGRTEIRSRVEAVADRLGLSDLLSRWPQALSGGQRQRVALGRALARRPPLLLLDEPFTALDAPLRLALRSDLLALQRAEGFTMLHVTHDQAEAMALGDRLAVLAAGELVGHDTPTRLYDDPPNRTIAGFLGSPPMQFVTARLEPGDSTHLVLGEPGSWIRAERTGPLPPVLAEARGGLVLGLRPEHLAVGATPAFTTEAVLTGTLDALEPQGHERHARVRPFAQAPGWTVRLRREAAEGLVVGATVPLRLDLGLASWFDPTTGQRRTTG